MVFNDSSRDYTEEYNGEEILVPAKGSILMNRRDAVKFLGTYSGPDPKDSTKPKEKRLRIIQLKPETSENGSGEYVCNLDGKTFNTQEELDEYLKKISDQTAEREDSGIVKPKKYK